MAGQIKSMIDSIISQRARGNATLIQTTKCKLILKGVNPNQFDSNSPDDETVIAKLRAIGTELGVKI